MQIKASHYKSYVSFLLTAFTLACSTAFNTCAAQSVNLPLPSHIIVLWEENQINTDITGSTGYAPYIKALSLDTNAAVFTQMFGETHPSQPNYLDFFSGSDQGVIDDNIPSNYPFTTDNLARELIDSSKTFITYSQDLPYVGFDSASFGSYARKHNPVTNWVGTGIYQVTDSTNQPFSLWPDSSHYGSLPTVSFVVPNEDSDMHNGFGATAIAPADYWFHEHLHSLLPWILANNALLIITWDEDDGLAANNIPTIFYGPMVKGGSYPETINHILILRTIEDMYGLRYAGGAAAVSPITDCWKVPTIVTGLQPLDNSDIKIFPNPATETMTVQSSNLMTSIEITDLLGRQLALNQVNQNRYRLPVGNLASGNYLLLVHTQNGVAKRMITVLKN